MDQLARLATTIDELRAFQCNLHVVKQRYSGRRESRGRSGREGGEGKEGGEGGEGWRKDYLQG